MTAPQPPTQFFLNMLNHGNVLICLDPRHVDVRVPDEFLDDERLYLEIGFHTPVPMSNLHVNVRRIACMLSFGGQPYFCELPWSSIVSLGNPVTGETFLLDRPAVPPPAGVVDLMTRRSARDAAAARVRLAAKS
jgi:stringent starvation protein B